MTPAEMKQMFLDRVDLGSSDLNHLSESLSSLYIDLQSDVVKRVTVEPIAGTEYTWVDGETGRSDSGNYDLVVAVERLRAIPEPSAMLLLSGLAIGLGLRRRR